MGFGNLVFNYTKPAWVPWQMFAVIVLKPDPLGLERIICSELGLFSLASISDRLPNAPGTVGLGNPQTLPDYLCGRRIRWDKAKKLVSTWGGGWLGLCLEESAGFVGHKTHFGETKLVCLPSSRFLERTGVCSGELRVCVAPEVFIFKKNPFQFIGMIIYTKSE